jgi:hypothetical protein
MWESLDKHRVLYIGSPTITKRTKESRVWKVMKGMKTSLQMHRKPGVEPAVGLIKNDSQVFNLLCVNFH